MPRFLTVRRVVLLGFLVAGIVSAWLVHSALQAVAAQASAPPGWPTITLTTITSGVSQPIFVTNAADGSGRIFIVERAGTVRIFKNGSLNTAPFLDIISRTDSVGGEQGLLSIAFPPNYAVSHHFYAYYTNLNDDLTISRFQVTSDPDVASAISETVVITIDHHSKPPNQINHNGGQLQFGPSDGYLYLATGDGGGGGDGPNNSQTHDVLLGKMLRLDVETGNPVTYTIPASNPYTATAGYRPEIWALGLRNPWRFSFDRQTHDLFIGDVGQMLYEEVDRQSAASQGGENYGWHIMEANHCYNQPTCVPPPQYSPPITEYDHNSGDCAIIGGYVYRGTRFVLPRGIYFFSDACTGSVWGLRFDGSAWRQALLTTKSGGLSSFGEDEDGNLYAVDVNSDVVYRIDSVETHYYMPVVLN